MIRKVLNTKVIYEAPLVAILNHIKELGLRMDNFTMKVTRFDVTRSSKYIVKEDRLDMSYSVTEYTDILEMCGKLKVFFISNAGEPVCVKLKIFVTYPNTFNYSVYVKAYIYTYMKAMIENDKFIRSIYPGGKINLPDDIYRGDDVFGLNQIAIRSTDYDKKDILSIISDK